MKNKLKITLKIVSNTLMILMVILAILIVGVKAVGIDVLIVLSPSMEPDYPTGSLIYLVDVDPAELKEGDVITFRLTESTTGTHRIAERVPDENDPDIIRFRTKGDNNPDYDTNLVEFEQVEGKVIFCIPYLGILAKSIQSPPGTYIALGVALAIILFVMAVDAVTNDKKRQKGENPDEKI